MDRAIASKFAFTLLRDIFIRNDATYAAENPAIGSYRHAAALLRGTKR